MKIHEYQAKEIFRKYKIPTSNEKAAASLSEAKSAMQELSYPVVVKAQVLVGGRGKAGGVKLVKNEAELTSAVNSILGMNIKGLIVNKLLIAEALKLESEYYVGITIDREKQTPVLIASASGGVDIEQVAQQTPEKILSVSISPLLGLKSFQARNLGYQIFNDTTLVNSFVSFAASLSQIFFDLDCSLVEINPLVLTENKLVAVDAKIVFDDNALYRHPDIAQLRDLSSEEPSEVQAKKADLSYVKLDGNVGCVVNGAGLAMATMDLIKRYGGEPANFLDIGGSSSPDKMREAMRIITADKNVKAILVNIFGGITRCDDVAQGLLWALKEEHISLPIIARLVGTNQDKARTMLENSPITFAKTMTEGVKQTIAALKG
ncbi:MAG: ADP-forming succinate--CoA ligase subunit beta [Candidatus Latescibacteria bacterium]|nr:ADP-forming succinate--CoA ligase subunit beta [Candidatus Latescibacterota bacterium]